MRRQVFPIFILLFAAFFVFINQAKAEDFDVDTLKNTSGITWTDLSSVGTTLTAGYYELKGDYYFDKQMTSNLNKGESVYIDLNGHKLTYGGWANWESEGVPANYLGTINAAFYGTNGNLYIFDSKDGNSIDIDFSLAEGFENIILKHMSYNASAWRNLIITSGTLEIYDSSVNDINHAGAASFVVGAAKYKNADLKITSMYVSSLVDIVDSTLHFYTASDCAIRYMANSIGSIQNSTITSDSKLFFGTNVSSATSELTITDSQISITKEELGADPSISTNWLVAKNSSLTNLARIEIRSGATKQTLIENCEFVLLSNGGSSFNLLGPYSSTADYSADILFKDSTLTIAGELVSGFRNVVIDNCHVLKHDKTKSTNGTALLGYSKTVTITDSEIETIFTLLNGGGCINVTIKDSSIQAINSNISITAPSAEVIAENSTLNFLNPDKNYEDMKIKSMQFTDVTYEGGPLLVYGDATVNSSSIEIFCSGGQTCFYVSAGPFVTPVTGTLIANDSKIIKNKLNAEAKNNAFILTQKDCIFTNVEVVSRERGTIKTNGAAEISISGNLNWNNVNYRGGVMIVGSYNSGGEVRIVDSNLEIFQDAGTASLSSQNTEIINSKLKRAPESATKSNSFFQIKGTLTMKDVEMETREHGTLKTSKDAEIYVTKEANLDNVTYFGGPFIFHNNATITNSNLEVAHDGEAPAFTCEGVLVLDGTKMELSKDSSSPYLDFIRVYKNIDAKNSEIKIGEKDQLASETDDDRAGVWAYKKLIFDHMNYIGGRLQAGYEEEFDIEIRDSNLYIYTNNGEAFSITGEDVDDQKAIFVENTEIIFSALNKDITLFTGGYATYKGDTIRTDTNVALMGPFTLDGETIVTSVGDYSIYLNQLNNIKLGKDFYLMEEAGIFNEEIEQDIKIPVFAIDFETNYKEMNAKCLLFVNPYHSEYRLRYNTETKEMFWTPVMKVTFIDGEEEDIIYFFPNDEVEKEDKKDFASDTGLFEFLGWFSEKEGKGDKFVSGTALDTDGLIYYAAWRKTENPNTGAKILLFFSILIGMFVLLVLYKKKFKKIFSIE